MCLFGGFWEHSLLFLLGKQSSNSGPACGYPVSMTPNTSSPMAEHHPFPVGKESKQKKMMMS
jgi:hypothetical protein